MKTNKTVSFQRSDEQVQICELCTKLDDEDKIILINLYREMLISTQQLERVLKTDNLENIIYDLTNNQLFRTIVRKTFQSKYIWVNYECCHTNLVRFFHNLGEQDQNFQEKFNPRITKRIHQDLTEISIKSFQELKSDGKDFCYMLFKKQFEDIDKLEIQNEHKTLFTMGNKKKNREQKRAIKILQQWFLENIQSPYLTPEQKLQLQSETGLDGKQIQIWIQNSRERILAPLKEAKSLKNARRLSLSNKASPDPTPRKNPNDLEKKREQYDQKQFRSKTLIQPTVNKQEKEREKIQMKIQQQQNRIQEQEDSKIYDKKMLEKIPSLQLKQPNIAFLPYSNLIQSQPYYQNCFQYPQSILPLYQLSFVPWQFTTFQ